MAKRGWATLCLALLFVIPLPAAAATAADGDTPLERAGGWLANTSPAPGPGDEALVFTLLRAELWRPGDPEVQEYVRETLVLLEDGGAARQPLANSAWQALALSAAGIELEAVVPSLLLALCDANALAEEGYAAQLPALVLFGGLQVEVPGDVLFSPSGLARTVAATQNEDGGFGQNGSDARATAMVMAALGGYVRVDEISSCLIEAQLWLQGHVNENGGFNDGNGVEDPYATAYAMLALDSMGYNPELLSYNTPSMLELLLTFQNPDGSFAPGGTDAQDYTLSLLGTAAATACWRFTAGKSPFASLEDVVPQDPTALMPQTLATNQSEGVWRTALLVLAAVAALALVLFLVIHIRRRARRK